MFCRKYDCPPNPSDDAPDTAVETELVFAICYESRFSTPDRQPCFSAAIPSPKTPDWASPRHHYSASDSPDSKKIICKPPSPSPIHLLASNESSIFPVHFPVATLPQSPHASLHASLTRYGIRTPCEKGRRQQERPRASFDAGSIQTAKGRVHQRTQGAVSQGLSRSQARGPPCVPPLWRGGYRHDKGCIHEEVRRKMVSQGESRTHSPANVI